MFQTREMREAAQRDDLRDIWENKCLSPDPDAISARRNAAANRLLLKGNYEPTLREIDKERALIEEEMFIPWLAEKRAGDYARV